MRVLVVDDDVSARFPLERALRKVGIETGSATSVRHAIDRLRNEPYDVVITDVVLGGADATSLLQWVGSFSPSTKTFIVSAATTDEIRDLYGKSGVRIFPKPADHDQIVAALEDAGPRRGFYGNAIELEFFDYVQMVALSGRDKTVEVQTPSGKGLIWFEHGDIVHCEYADFRGETAFYKLLAVNRGTFREVFNRRAPRHTVTRSSTHLLMEAARQADEGTLGLDAPGAEPESPPTPAPVEAAPPTPAPEESSFEELNDPGSLEVDISAPGPATAPVQKADIPVAAAAPVALDEPTHPLPRTRPGTRPDNRSAALQESSMISPEDSAAMSMAAGHAVFDDPDTRTGMLDQFWQFEGINGVAIISSTGKVLAEDMRSNSSLVTLAGFYMRGAARIARTLGFNVFDGVVARSTGGQQMVMVSMGAASAVLSVAPGVDPESVRDQVMGVE
jgi:CheY-like chemotaxis protein